MGLSIILMTSWKVPWQPTAAMRSFSWRVEMRPELVAALVLGTELPPAVSYPVDLWRFQQMGLSCILVTSWKAPWQPTAAMRSFSWRVEMKPELVAAIVLGMELPPAVFHLDVSQLVHNTVLS